MIRSFYLAFLALTAIAAPAFAGPGPGDPAPPLTIETLLQAPEGAAADWEHLKGKVVIVDFWATWCGPCIASIPHMNALAEKFKDQPVQFISVTNEKPEVVEPFIARRKMAGWIGLDTDSAAQKAYGVTGIPHTFIIKDGKVLGDTHPASLTAEHIEKALKGEDLGLTPQGGGEVVPAEGKTAAYGRSYIPGEFPGVGFDQNPVPQPMAQIVVRPALAPDGGTFSGSHINRVTYINTPASSVVRLAYGRAYGVADTRVEVKAKLADQKLDVAIWAPGEDPATFRQYVDLGIGGALGLAARTEEREVDVLLLKAGEDAAKKLEPTVSTGGSSVSTRREGDDFIVTAVNQAASQIASTLEYTLKQPVIDETGLAGKYDFEMLVARDVETAQRELAKLGLRLEPARRKVTYRSCCWRG